MMSSKKLEKIAKILGDEVMNAISVLDKNALKDKVVNASNAIKEAGEALEANAEYQALREKLADLSAGYKEVKKYQNAIIAYSLDTVEGYGHE